MKIYNVRLYNVDDFNNEIKLEYVDTVLVKCGLLYAREIKTGFPLEIIYDKDNISYDTKKHEKYGNFLVVNCIDLNKENLATKEETKDYLKKFTKTSYKKIYDYMMCNSKDNFKKKVKCLLKIK